MHDEIYHYVECGLDDVHLMNGFERFTSVRGTSIAIRDVDALHRAIGEGLCQKKKLNGKEIRFLRREMLMSQTTLARLFDVKEQTVHRWETEKTGIPKAAEALVRFLYTEQTNRTQGTLRESLEKIADLEDEIDRTRRMIFRLTLAEGKTDSVHRDAAEWRLAA